MLACCIDAILAAALGGSVPFPAPCPAASVAPAWEGVEAIPGDVDLYIHVDGAASLRRRMQQLPLAQAFDAAFVGDEVTGCWSSISKRLGRNEVECFDELLGRELRFAMRRTSEGVDWLLATELDDATLARVRNGLGGRMAAGGIIEFPCQRLVAAWRPPTLFVSRSLESPLLRRAIGDAAPAGDAAAPTLAADPLVASARHWPSSQLQLFVRHGAPLEGASVFAADLAGRVATVRHRMRAEGACAAANSELAPIDAAVLDRFESISLAGTVRRQCDASILALVEKVLPGCAPCEGMRRNAGDRWLMLVGGSGPDASSACQVPMIALAVEVQEPCQARRQHEAFLHRAVERYNERFASRFGAAIEPPPVAACTDLEAPRHCDISAPLRAASGDHPLLRNCSLHWRTVAGDGGTWQVYASNRGWLDAVSMRLEEADETPSTPRLVVAANDSAQESAASGGTAAVTPTNAAALATPANHLAAAAPSSGAPAPAGVVAGRSGSIEKGFLCGAPVASMLESWGRAAEEFAPDEPDRFRRGVSLLASLLRGVECLRWSETSAESGETLTIVRIELAPPSAP